MTAVKIEAWIACLGQTYEELLKKSLLPDEDFIELFPEDDSLYLEPLVGVAMSFWAKTERLETIFVTLKESMPGIPIYAGDLPALYSSCMNQADVRARFGTPLGSSGPIRMPEPMGWTGGWDTFDLEPENYPNIKVKFQYLASMDLKCIVFTLVDKGRK